MDARNTRKVYGARRFVFAFDIWLSWIPKDLYWKSYVYSDNKSGRQWSVCLKNISSGYYAKLAVLFLVRSAHPNRPAIVKCLFDITDYNGKLQGTAKSLSEFSCKHGNTSEDEFCEFRSAEVEVPQWISEDDHPKHVIVTTEFESLEETVELQDYETLPAIVITSNKFTTDILTLMTDKQFSDVVIRADGVDIPAHKAILTARSPVFAAMFRHDVLEAEGRVVIEDFSAEVIRQFLEFLYTGQQPEFTDECAVELLKASEKYEVSDLKEMCENYLSKHIKSYDAIEMFVLADKLRAASLRKCALDSVCSNIKTFKENDQLRDLSKSLLMEIMWTGMGC